jgi:hypothetical protein
MDSKDVSKAIKSEIWPALKNVGFGRTSTRTAWREHSDRVDVINIGSFNSLRTPAPHITSYSFGVHVGCYLKYIPRDGDRIVERRTGAIQPEQHDCHARTSLERGYRDFLESAMIWRIDADGRKLQKAIDDARRVILEHGQGWLAHFSSPRAVYDLLASNSSVARDAFMTTPHASPHNDYLLGYAALAAGLREQACRHLLAAADSGSFAFEEERLRRDSRRATQDTNG